MKKKQRLTLIVVALVLFSIFFSNVKVLAVADSYAGTEEEEEVYTIEDVIFNNIPIFDINFFSDKAGGLSVAEDSVVGIIRKTVATWYVSFRNLVIMALSIIIIYVGIRMAISTIPQDKAKYKEMLVGWFKSLLIVLFIHFAMYIVINLNESLVGILENAMINSVGEEQSIYETIRTRAYDIRPTVGIPGMIMYIALVITWVRFLWVYAKRMFTVLILVIIAPFIGAKYAIDSASGKKGSSFGSWLYDFVMNVFLQSVHALVYITIMVTSLNLAVESVTGFIIALIFMNFMLSADELVRNIMNFDKSGLAKQAAKQEEIKDIKKAASAAIFVGTMGKASIGVVKGVKNKVQDFGKDLYKGYTRRRPGDKEKINGFLNKQDLRIENFIDPKNSKNQKGVIYNARKAAAESLRIRRLARHKGAIGAKSKRLKKQLKSNRSKRYKANFKLVKSAVTGVGDIFLAIPVATVSTTAGVAMFTKGVKSISGISKKKYVLTKNEKGTFKGWLKKRAPYQRWYGVKKGTEKYEKKRNKTYTAINLAEEIANEEDLLKEKMGDIRNYKSEDDIAKYKKKTGVFLIEANSSKISDIISNYIHSKNISSIDNSTINDIIDVVVDELNIDSALDNTSKSLISSTATSMVLMAKSKANAKARQEALDQGKEPPKQDDNKFTSDEIVKAIHSSISSTETEREWKDMTNNLFDLDRKINKFERAAKASYRGTNEFLINL